MMYISAKELSILWNMDVRTIQRYCASGKIIGAYKTANAWLIPSDASKIYYQETTNEFYPCLFMIDSFVYPIGEAECVLSRIENGQIKTQLQRELAYYKGDFYKHYPAFKDSSQLNLCNRMILFYEGVAQSNYTVVNQSLKELHIMLHEVQDEVVQSVLKIGLYTIESMYGIESEEIKIDNIAKIPLEMRKCISLMYAYHYCNNMNYERAIGILEASLYCNGELHTVRDIYIHLQCAFAYYKLDKVDKTKENIYAAIALSVADGFVMPFVDYFVDLGSMLRECMRDTYPEFLEKVEKIGNSVWNNKIAFYNMKADQDITTSLTAKEYQVAKLIVEGHSNQEIALILHCSLSTIKSRVENIFGKLMIKKRIELSEFISTKIRL